jgi:predicted DNA-binding transcriptional regulator YafY
MDDGSVLFSLDVILNHELERDLLGYGEGITVLSPQDLSCKIQERLIKTLKKYQTKKET